MAQGARKVQFGGVIIYTTNGASKIEIMLVTRERREKVRELARAEARDDERTPNLTMFRFQAMRLILVTALLQLVSSSMAREHFRGPC